MSPRSYITIALLFCGLTPAQLDYQQQNSSHCWTYFSEIHVRRIWFYISTFLLGLSAFILVTRRFNMLHVHFFRVNGCERVVRLGPKSFSSSRTRAWDWVAFHWTIGHVMKFGPKSCKRKGSYLKCQRLLSHLPGLPSGLPSGARKKRISTPAPLRVRGRKRQPF